MANPDHLEMLRQGVDAWNVWREQQPVEPDLSEADHREMDFFGGTDLTDANSSEARFRAAHFNWQGLRDVDLTDADLSWADLSRANLLGARLSQSILAVANLRKADLS